MNIQTIELSKINPAEYNPRVITDDEFSGLKESIKTFGQQENLIVNKDMTLISGHQRLNAMLALGWTEAVCNVVDLDKRQEKKLNVIMNSTAISGKYDDLKLSEILEELKLDDDYESLRLNVLEPLDLSPTEVEEDEAPEVSQEPPVSKLGEIYQLGRHRVMCGDSTDKASVELLMNGVKADMVFTDPPYGVDYDGGHAVKGVRRDKLENDGTPDIYADSLPNAVELSKDGAAFYVWYSDSKSLAVLQAVLQAGLEVRNHIIWNKNVAQFGAIGAQYKSKHEPCLYMFKRGKSPNWYGANNEVSVWDISRASKNEFHPTQKPVELVARAINNSSKYGDNILDLFLGSGSTLIACEQTDRTCYGMELDPKYVDVIRKRYAKFIGQEDNWQEVTKAI